ncbi:MAG: hypothetical protein JG776_884 [Caloramator sp.]|jgi:chaperonin cofactor prefoldin|uniref:hypothetical protein n=1 Tax=unclassified Caloramator TaxID=2629145 RepID=UPI000403E9DC|nr:MULTISPECIES: hypothetical protein [unclassified Caloramator]MBZ4663182.1 hypothetical protein [Caloramator sp.]
MLQKNARQNVEESVQNLQNTLNSLRQAATTVENQNTKAQIEQQIQSIQNTLNACQNIANTLRQQ